MQTAFHVGGYEVDPLGPGKLCVGGDAAKGPEFGTSAVGASFTGVTGGVATPRNALQLGGWPTSLERASRTAPGSFIDSILRHGSLLNSPNASGSGQPPPASKSAADAMGCQVTVLARQYVTVCSMPWDAVLPDRVYGLERM
jgi:hypothetical protein